MRTGAASPMLPSTISRPRMAFMVCFQDAPGGEQLGIEQTMDKGHSKAPG